MKVEFLLWQVFVCWHIITSIIISSVAICDGILFRTEMDIHESHY